MDASSSAALAAYINSLNYELSQPNSWLSSPWHVRSGTYCCFNAFSRIDIRVEVRIPGGVQAYVVDLRGEHHAPSPEVWQEVYLSALLRSIYYADDPNYRLSGYRKLDPISSPEAEHRFLQAAENLFFKGWQLGSDPEIQVATVVKNHLAQGILKYFGDANRMELAVNLFEKLYARESECAALVAQAYLTMNEEIKAVTVMHEALLAPLNAQGTTMSTESYALLHVQADFLRARGEVEWARELATAAVKCAPSEFLTWAKLTQSFIDLGRWEDALYTLNSCPMFTFNERDLHRMPPAARTHLPIKSFLIDSGLLAEDPASNPVLQNLLAGAPTAASEADVALLRLPAPALRGTFAQAYALLTELVSKIGWDELLKRRSNVFFMEEEYRAQKAGQEPRSTNAADPAPAPNGRIPTSDGKGENGTVAKEGSDSSTSGSNPSVPEIKISSETDRQSMEEKPVPKESFDAEAPGISRPVEAARQDGDDTAHANGEVSVEEVSEGEKEVDKAYALSNRRLCERWLDNLFMVLYEDLRVYTIWRAELEHYLNVRRPYVKTSLEWEILGDLAMRLHHPAEAKDAYLRCLDVSGSAPNGVGAPGHWSAGLGGAVGSTATLPSAATVQQNQGLRFSAKAHLALLEMFTKERDVKAAVWLAVKLTAYQHRWYAEGSYPGAVGKALFALIETDGLAKVSYTLVSLDPPKAILRLMQNYFAYAQLFRVPGWDF